MKNYTITVNGNVYDVVVEEGASTGAPVAAPNNTSASFTLPLINSTAPKLFLIVLLFADKAFAFSKSALA